MTKNNKSMELTEELFIKISGDKQQQIAKLRVAKSKILTEEEILHKDLADYEAQIADLEGKIRLTKASLSLKEKNKHKINKNMRKQIRLANSINKIFANENPQYVYVDKFYPEQPKTKTKTKKR